MAYGLSILDQPETEPLTLEQVRSHLRLSQTDDDSELSTLWIPAARREIEKAIGVALITQTLRLTLDHFPLSFPGHAIELPIGPVQSVASITYYDTDNVLQTVDDEDYLVETTTGRVVPAEGCTWPATFDRPGAVRVNFVAGFGDAAADVPAGLRSAMLIQVREMYEGNVAGELSPTVDRLLSLEWDGSRHGQHC